MIMPLNLMTYNIDTLYSNLHIKVHCRMSVYSPGQICKILQTSIEPIFLPRFENIVLLETSATNKNSFRAN